MKTPENVRDNQKECEHTLSCVISFVSQKWRNIPTGLHDTDQSRTFPTKVKRTVELRNSKRSAQKDTKL